jgi:hypothetical protein
MANLSDLVDLVAAYRRAADRMFESETAKLRLQYGDRTVSEALRLAKQIEQVSIDAERQRHQQAVADERRAQTLRQRRDRLRSLGPPLPPGWR